MRAFGFLSPKAQSHVAIAPNTPIAAFVKLLRCRKCGPKCARNCTRLALPNISLIRSPDALICLRLRNAG